MFIFVSFVTISTSWLIHGVCVRIPSVHVHNAKDGIKRFNYKDSQQAELADYFALSNNEYKGHCFFFEARLLYSCTY